VRDVFSSDRLKMHDPPTAYIHVAVSVEHRLVTDGWADRHDNDS